MHGQGYIYIRLFSIFVFIHRGHEHHLKCIFWGIEQNVEWLTRERHKDPTDILTAFPSVTHSRVANGPGSVSD